MKLILIPLLSLVPFAVVILGAEGQLALTSATARDRRLSIVEDPRHEGRNFVEESHIRRGSLSQDGVLELNVDDASRSSLKSVIIHVVPHNDSTVARHLAHHVESEERLQIERLRRRTKVAIVTAIGTTATAAVTLIVHFTSKCN